LPNSNATEFIHSAPLIGFLKPLTDYINLGLVDPLFTPEGRIFGTPGYEHCGDRAPAVLSVALPVVSITEAIPATVHYMR